MDTAHGISRDPVSMRAERLTSRETVDTSRHDPLLFA
jgi:hypothetical protein